MVLGRHGRDIAGRFFSALEPLHPPTMSAGRGILNRIDAWPTLAGGQPVGPSEVVKKAGAG